MSSVDEVRPSFPETPEKNVCSEQEYEEVEAIDELVQSAEINNCQNWYEVEFIDETDVNDLVDILSNSRSPDKNEDVLDISLNDIPLTEISGQIKTDENIFNENLLIIKVPEEMENSSILETAVNISLNQSDLDAIDEAIDGHDGVIVAKVEKQPAEIPRRSPLQLVQQATNRPTSIKNRKPKKAVNLPSKRKQDFQTIREEVMEFYSDDEERDEAVKENVKEAAENSLVITEVSDAKTETENDAPPVKKRKVEKKVKTENETKEKPEKAKLPKIDEKPLKVEKCQKCNMTFKRLSLHKCKILDPVEIPTAKKLKPSDIPMPLKCNICREFFSTQQLIDKHQLETHSHLVCKTCKLVMKNASTLKFHSLKCGLNIEAIKKFNLRKK